MQRNNAGRIMVVDDDTTSRECMSLMLRDAGYEVCSAADGASALAALESFRPDLVITDLSMPHLGGYGLVQCIREQSPVADVPIILISGHSDTINRVHGFELGADDFMAKPVDMAELLARVSRHLRRATQEREAARLSVSDELTGMLNRRGIQNFFARAQSECTERAQPVSVIVVDLTRFKAINDRYGHAVGDLALCTVARTLQDAVRASDRVGRIGGDEFLIVLPGLDERGCAQLEARLRACLPILLRLTGQDKVAIDFAVGSATGGAQDSLATLTARADAAMYAEKAMQYARAGSETSRR